MRRKPSSYPDKETFLGRKRGTPTSSGGSSFTQKESLRHPSEVSPLNTRDTKKCSVKKSRRGYPNTPFGITPSNYSHGHLIHYQDDSFPLPRAKLLKHRSS